MKGLSVVCRAETASFRDPGGQLYHACLPLPPYTTLVGIAGAALGLSFPEATCYFKEHRIHVGVLGHTQGHGKDLWNYTKRTVFDDPKEKNDIVLREFLFRFGVVLFYAAQESAVIDRLETAFAHPIYALTLGASEDLAKVVSIEKHKEIKTLSTTDIKNTILQGDISSHYRFDWEKVKKTPIRLTLKGPVVKSLPVDFEFDAHGARKGSKYQTFSFIDSMIKLTENVSAYQFGDYKIPLYSPEA